MNEKDEPATPPPSLEPESDPEPEKSEATPRPDPGVRIKHGWTPGEDARQG